MAYLNGNMNIMRFVARESEAPRYKGIFPLPIDSVGGKVSEWYLYGNKNGVGEKRIVEGNLPLDFVSDGTDLENYRFYGTAEGAGETENLFNKNANDTNNGYASGKYLAVDNHELANEYYVISEYIQIQPSTTYYLSNVIGSGSATALCFYNANKEYISGVKLYASGTRITEVTSPDDAVFLRTTIQVYSGYIDIAMITKTETADYIPFGYKISILVTSGTETKNTVIPIGDTKLMAGDYIDYKSGKVFKADSTEITIDLPAIETFNGENTLDSTETLGEVTITQGYHVPLDIRSLSDTNEITKAYRADINETAGATIDVDRQAGTVTINGTTNNAVAEVIFYMTLTEGDYWYSGVPNQEDNSIMAKLMNTHIRPPYEFNKWDGSEPGSDIGYGEEAVVNASPVRYRLYFAPNHTFNNFVIKPKLQKATITTHKDIYTGSSPLTEGQSVSRDSTGIEIEVEQGTSVIETTLTNKPEMNVVPDSYEKLKEMVLGGTQ